jgi:capsular exopolysaccharide synthesis family protein
MRTNLQFLQLSDEGRSFVVTSSVAAEGKSTTSANLALTIAATGKRVILVEADLRRPKLSEYLGVVGTVGLTNVLIGLASLDDVLQPWGDGALSVLPAGRIPPNPSELLGSPAMRDLLRVLEKSYDMVILDAPPLLPVTDAAILAGIASGAIIVVASGRTRREQLSRSVEILDGVGARTLGIVMNFLPVKGPDAYTYGGLGGYESVKPVPKRASSARGSVLPGRGRRRARR